MSHQGAPRWRRRPLLSLCARSAAFVLPLVVSGVAAVLVLEVFSGWPAAWRVVWWTCAIVGATGAALVFVPLAHRLSALGLLLGLEVEFPSPPPARVRLAVRTSSLASAQLELERTPRRESADELLTARLATASMLGVFRTMQVRSKDHLRVFSTVGVALCIAVAALLVLPDRAQLLQRPIASEQQAESTNGNDATTTVPTTTPDSSNDGGDDRRATDALPSVSGTGPAEASNAVPNAVPAAPESASGAADDATGTADAESAATSSAGQEAVAAVAAATPSPPSDAGPALRADSVGHADRVGAANPSSLDTGVQAASIPPPVAVTTAALAPAPAMPTPTAQAESDDVTGATRGPVPNVEPGSGPPHGADRATDEPRSDDEHRSTDAPSPVEYETGVRHLSESCDPPFADPRSLHRNGS